MRIAINGFGRIGRTFLRTMCADPAAQKMVDVKVINIGPMDKDLVAHLFMYDSIMGAYAGRASLEGSVLSIDGNTIDIIAYQDPQECQWGNYGIEWVVDCSGKFTQREKAQQHLHAGAKAVLISAPADGEDVTIIPGVNDALFIPDKHTIVSLGSCTTNALVPTLKVISDAFGLRQAWVTTTHAYTNSQALLDTQKRDPRVSRAAPSNIIPTSSGASTSVEKVMPELKGKLCVCALRVPVPIVSLLEVIFDAGVRLSRERINEVFFEASRTKMSGIVEITDALLVSSDYRGNSHSIIIDAPLTQVSEGTQARVFGWYDNEWAYSMRMKEFLVQVAKRLKE